MYSVKIWASHLGEVLGKVRIAGQAAVSNHMLDLIQATGGTAGMHGVSQVPRADVLAHFCTLLVRLELFVWAARYITWLFAIFMPTGVVFSFPFLSSWNFSETAADSIAQPCCGANTSR